MLSAGRHAKPRHGACVMEYVTVLAGERWSDEPRCVDPALAALARAVNDSVSDDARQRLALLAPDFIGTVDVDDGTRYAAASAVLAAALRQAPDADRQFLLCVAILGLRQFAGRSLHCSLDAPDDVLERARGFVMRHPASPGRYAVLGLPTALVQAVRVVHDSSRDPVDDALVHLLTDALRRYRVGMPGCGVQAPWNACDTSRAPAAR